MVTSYFGYQVHALTAVSMRSMYSIISHACHPLILKNRERVWQTCTSGMSPFRNFQMSIRLQYIVHDNSSMQRMLLYVHSHHARKLVPYHDQIFID